MVAANGARGSACSSVAPNGVRPGKFTNGAPEVLNLAYLGCPCPVGAPCLCGSVATCGSVVLLAVPRLCGPAILGTCP